MSKKNDIYWSSQDFSTIHIDSSKISDTSNSKQRDYSSIHKLLEQSDTFISEFTHTDLRDIKRNFHNLIHYRCRRSGKIITWLKDNQNELPKITNELSQMREPLWISIPGMYGGFSYGLIERNGKPVLLTESWIRVVSGSGQQHEITPSKVDLVAKGFV